MIFVDQMYKKEKASVYGQIEKPSSAIYKVSNNKCINFNDRKCKFYLILMINCI